MKITAEQARRLEEELARIRNVSYSSIVLDDEGEITNVDLLTDTERPPQPIVRDAEAIFRKQGVPVDHRKIGVVQMTDPSGLQPAGPSEGLAQVATHPGWGRRERIQLAAVHSTTSAGVFQAEVELTLGAFEGAPGRSEGPARDPETCVEVVARATLEAVRNLLKPGYEVQLRAVQLSRLSGLSLVTAVVDYGHHRQTVRLAGTCPERGSLYETAAYAVLDALNRPLGRAEFRDLMVQDEEAGDEQVSWRAASA